MEKKIVNVISLLCILIVTPLLSQNTSEPKPSILFLNIGLKQSFQYAQPNSPLFADGFAEYLTKENFGIRGSCTQYITDRNEQGLYQNSTGIAFGGVFHQRFQNPIHDLSVSLLPGVSWVSIQPLTEEQIPSSIIPTLTTGLQYTLLFSRFCNFYFNVSHYSAWFRGTPKGSINLSDFSVTGGLGFHLFFKNNHFQHKSKNV